MTTFTILVDDNFHPQNESERYELGPYDSFSEAADVCKGIVDRFLAETRTEDMTAEALYSKYLSFGEDPWIHPTPEGQPDFSAWDYAKARCSELTAETSAEK